MTTYTHNVWVFEGEEENLKNSEFDYTMREFEKKKFIRDIKMKMVFIETKIPIIESRFTFKEHRKNYQNLIENLSSIGVVCGSFSLYTHGLIDRPPKDIDLLVDKNSEKIKEFIRNNSKKVNKHKTDSKSSFNNKVPSFEPVEQFKDNDLVIDMFHDTNVKCFKFGKIIFQCPFQVIQKKIDIYEAVNRSKDFKDLKLISKRLDNIIENQGCE